MTVTSDYQAYYSAILTFRSRCEEGKELEANIGPLLDEAKAQGGFIGDESVIDPQSTSIVILYFSDLESLNSWHEKASQPLTDDKGAAKGSLGFKIHLGKTLREYSFDATKGKVS